MTMEEEHNQSPDSAGSDAAFAERRQNEDRRRRRKYRFRDRRSGFQRRTAGVKMGVFARALHGLRDRPRVLAGVLLTVNALNLVDFLLTVLVLDAGGREANPILRPLFSVHPLAVGIFKLVVVSAAALIVWKSRYYKLALITGLFMFMLFTCLVVYDFVLLALLKT